MARRSRSRERSRESWLVQVMLEPAVGGGGPDGGQWRGKGRGGRWRLPMTRGQGVCWQRQTRVRRTGERGHGQRIQHHLMLRPTCFVMAAYQERPAKQPCPTPAACSMQRHGKPSAGGLSGLASLAGAGAAGAVAVAAKAGRTALASLAGPGSLAAWQPGLCRSSTCVRGR